jgi:hypothetical protein
VKKRNTNTRTAKLRQVVNAIVVIVVGTAIARRKRPKGMEKPFVKEPSRCI